MSLIPSDLTPVLRETADQGAGPVRWQLPHWIDRLPPCNHACPAGENIQGWLAHAREGDFEAAWRLLVGDNPLPGIHGRACYHPCESGCNRGDLDEPVAIHAVERMLGDMAVAEGWTVPAGPPTGKRVLIVGAGPAGLSCAWHLRLLGHEVEIRDEHEKPGGMMHYGIPAYRLPRDELEREIDRIAAMGVTMTMGTRVDDIEAAMADFDACFVAVGTHAGNHLDIPAADGSHMVDAISMLEQVEKGEAPLLGRTVGVIGGGNTAMDAARVARRLGAEEAILIYRRDRAHMRADPYEADEAFLEGVQAKWLSAPVGFDATGVQVEKIELDESGELKPTGTYETLSVDSLVLALGQHADVDFLRDVEGVVIGRNGSIGVDSALMTGRPGLFAGGDAIGGLMTMTAATGHGKRAARAIDAFLAGRPVDAPQPAEPIPFPDLHLPLFLDAGQTHPSELPVAARTGFAEVVAAISERQGRYEAERCLSCGVCFTCDNCLAACPEQAITRVAGGPPHYVADPDLCTGCAVCFDQCPCHAITMQPAETVADAKAPPRFTTRA